MRSEAILINYYFSFVYIGLNFISCWPTMVQSFKPCHALIAYFYWVGTIPRTVLENKQTSRKFNE